MAYSELSGFNQAADTYNQLYQNQTQRLQQQAQQQYYEDRIRLEEEQRQAAEKEKERQRYAQWQQGQYIRRAMETNNAKDLVKQGIAGDMSVAEKMRQAAIEMMGTDPSGGLDLLEKANKMRKNAAESESAEFEADTKRKEAAAGLMKAVLINPDPSSAWEATKTRLASMGYAVPVQFNQYNDQTKQWLQQNVVGSKSALEAEKLELKNKNFKLEEEKFEFDKKIKEMREQRLRDKENESRERIQREWKKGRKVSGEELSELRKEFQGNEAFDDLSKEDQFTAAKEFDLIFRDILSQNPSLSATEARERAKEAMFMKIKDGTYVPYTTVTNEESAASGVAKPTSQDEFNKLPKGALYINPSDGKTYRKK